MRMIVIMIVIIIMIIIIVIILSSIVPMIINRRIINRTVLGSRIEEFSEAWQPHHGHSGSRAGLGRAPGRPAIAAITILLVE